MTDLWPWVELAVRWFHVIAAIFWIGTTLYLSRSARELVATPGDPDSAGRLLAVHGGALWSYEKLRTLPDKDAKVHWFKWESLLTWLSGMTLLAMVYWAGGMMEPLVTLPGHPVLWGAGAIVAGVLVYRLIWRFIRPGSVLEFGGIAASYATLVGLAYLLCRFFPGRAAYLHVAATLGTIMSVQNVWLTILPSQRQILNSLRGGGGFDEGLAARASRGTKHNTYMMVPVVLLMVSNHYPVELYGQEHNWLVLSVVVLVGWAGAYVHPALVVTARGNSRRGRVSLCEQPLVARISPHKGTYFRCRARAKQ